MKPVAIFRILTFILLPIAGIFGLICLFMLLLAFQNVGLLLGIFMIASFVIYVFASLIFLYKGIDTGRPCKPGLRDWIRVNSFVTIFMCASSLLSVISMLIAGDNSLYEQTIQMRNTLPDTPAAMPDTALLVKVLKLAVWFMGVLSALTLLHVFLNYRIMKQYKHLFSETPA